MKGLRLFSRRVVHSAVPSHFRDPLGLTRRLFVSGRDGRFAMYVAGLNMLATPIDLLLAARENELYRNASPPSMPLVIVCGPPRSGTTALTQALTRSLPVSYFNNLTAVFPRAPITVSRFLGVRFRNGRLPVRSHYGRSAGFTAPNDGLHLWDRWLGSDRTSICPLIESHVGEEMVRFFGAFEGFSQRSLVTKNNSMNAHAAVVADFLPTATFICLERDPVFLAQSLLIARRYIHGDEAVPYGLHDPEDAVPSEPAEDVCRQVLYHRALARRQLEILGPDRFRIVSYERFCDDPLATIEMVAQEVLDVPVDREGAPASLQPSRTRRLPDETLEFFQRRFNGGSRS